MSESYAIATCAKELLLWNTIITNISNGWARWADFAIPELPSIVLAKAPLVGDGDEVLPPDVGRVSFGSLRRSDRSVFVTGAIQAEFTPDCMSSGGARIRGVPVYPKQWLQRAW